MIRVSFSSHFKKSLKKKIKRNPVLEEVFLEKLKLFCSNPFHPSLRTHKLTGELNKLHSFSLGYDLRVIFYFVRKSEVIFRKYWHTDEVY